MLSQEAQMNLWKMHDEHYSKIVHITFIKRTTGEIRKMSCHLNCKKHLKGGEAPYDWKEKNLLPVLDLELAALWNQGIREKDGKPIKSPYRTINMDCILSYSCDKEKHEVTA